MSKPPRITREMLLDAGMQLLRQEGEDAVNVRRIAKALGCSTQPILYQFGTIQQFKDELFRRADDFHSRWLMQPDETAGNPLLSVGLRYIRFGAEEPHLFRFLFQSDRLGKHDLQAVMQNEALAPILSLIAQSASLTPEQAADVFAALELCAHGFASFLANNSMPYDPAYAARMLIGIYNGAVLASLNEQEEHHEEAV